MPRGTMGWDQAAAPRGLAGLHREPRAQALPRGLLRAPAGPGGPVLADGGAVLPVVAAHRDAAPQPVEAALVGEGAGGGRGGTPDSLCALRAAPSPPRHPR